MSAGADDVLKTGNFALCRWQIPAILHMDMDIIVTRDGSHTLFSRQFDEIYHSRHGAVGESMHVFIRSGLDACAGREIHIFEAGFGTGLNALLSAIYAESGDIQIHYHSIELYPVAPAIIARINYPELVGHGDLFLQMHEAHWDEAVPLTPHFTLHKIHASLPDFVPAFSDIDVIFFDAFSPGAQPELWTTAVFGKMYDILVPGGHLVTYCSKSAVRRDMQEAGFLITKLPGPLGKRDMVRAVKAR